jgi:hypothetical protein
MTRVFSCLAAAFAALCLSAPLLAQSRPSSTPTRPQGYGSIGQPSREQGLAALEQFRAAFGSESFYLEFVLEYVPRRGLSQSIPGRLWSGAVAGGQASIVEFPEQGGRPRQRWLLLNGEAPEVWVSEGEDGEPRLVSQEESFLPIGPTQFSPFLLQMPFIRWPDADYEGLERVRGRPAHAFRLRPGDGFPADHAGFVSVRLKVDSQFNALNEIEFLDASGTRTAIFSVGELTRVDDRWMVRWVDYRDERTRDRTRFRVVRAATGLGLPEWVFTPARLLMPAPFVSEDRIRTPGR